MTSCEGMLTYLDQGDLNNSTTDQFIHLICGEKARVTKRFFPDTNPRNRLLIDREGQKIYKTFHRGRFYKVILG